MVSQDEMFKDILSECKILLDLLIEDWKYMTIEGKLEEISSCLMANIFFGEGLNWSWKVNSPSCLCPSMIGPSNSYVGGPKKLWLLNTKIQKEWSLLYFVNRTDRSLPK